MEICSQHSDCNKVTREHGERIAVLETRIDKVEEVQGDMVIQLEEAAQGLRALAGKIDSAVSAAKKDGCQAAKDEFEANEKTKFSHSLDEAFEHFRNNFARFVVYSTAGGFVWFIFKSVAGDWKWDSNVLKAVGRIFGGG